MKTIQEGGEELCARLLEQLRALGNAAHAAKEEDDWHWFYLELKNREAPVAVSIAGVAPPDDPDPIRILLRRDRYHVCWDSVSAKPVICNGLASILVSSKLSFESGTIASLGSRFLKELDDLESTTEPTRPILPPSADDAEGAAAGDCVCLGNSSIEAVRPFADVQIGGCAALTIGGLGLLIDGGGRWHVDRAIRIAQRGEDLDVPGAPWDGAPYERPRVTDVRAWVHDQALKYRQRCYGRAALSLLPNNALQIAVNGSPLVTIMPGEHNPAVVIATGFPPEYDPPAYAKHKKETTTVLAADAALLEQNAQRWVRLRAQHVALLGDEVCEQRLTFSGKRVLVAGGGTAISAAEILLENGAEQVTLFLSPGTKSWIANSPQVQDMLGRHRTRFSLEPGKVRVPELGADGLLRHDGSSEPFNLFVAAIGRPKGLPPILEDVARTATQRRLGIMRQKLWDGERRYLGYSVTCLKDGRPLHLFEIVGAAAFFAPTEHPEVDTEDYMATLRLDAPPATAGYPGSFAVSARQGWRYAAFREASTPPAPRDSR